MAYSLKQLFVGLEFDVCSFGSGFANDLKKQTYSILLSLTHAELS